MINGWKADFESLVRILFFGEKNFGCFSQYEIDCLERTFEELIRLYPLIPVQQIEADMAEIREIRPEMRNQERNQHIGYMWLSLMV
jgi:hypothetical protein